MQFLKVEFWTIPSPYKVAVQKYFLIIYYKKNGKSAITIEDFHFKDYSKENMPI